MSYPAHPPPPPPPQAYSHPVVSPYQQPDPNHPHPPFYPPQISSTLTPIDSPSSIASTSRRSFFPVASLINPVDAFPPTQSFNVRPLPPPAQPSQVTQPTPPQDSPGPPGLPGPLQNRPPNLQSPCLQPNFASPPPPLSTFQFPPSATDDLKRPRACDHCRASKVKCVANETGPCRRCLKTMHACVFTISARKRQKRTDTRVAELEKKLEQLTQKLAVQTGVLPSSDTIRSKQGQIQQEPQIGAQSDHIENHLQSDTAQSTSVQPESSLKQLNWLSSSLSSSANVSATIPSASPISSTSPTTSSISTSTSSHQNPQADCLVQNAVISNKLSDSNGLGDYLNEREYFIELSKNQYSRLVTPSRIIEVLTRYEIDDSQAQDLLDLFMKTKYRQSSFLSLRSDIKFSVLLQSKPILALYIIGIAANIKLRTLADFPGKIMTEVYRMISEQMFLYGQRSIDIIQTLIMMTAWFTPPAVFACENFLVLSSCAGAIARDLGLLEFGSVSESDLNNHTLSNRSRRSCDTSQFRKPPRSASDADELENLRIAIGVYTASSVCSTVFRCEPSIRWSKYLQECCDILEARAKADKTDYTLYCLARLQSLVDNVLTILHCDDGTKPIDINDLHTNKMVSLYERYLIDWKESSPDDQYLLICYHSSQIIIHEIALRVDSNRRAFSAPFKLENLGQDTELQLPSPATAEAVIWCISSSQNLLEIFWDCDNSAVVFAPSHIIGRVIYACMVLMKIALLVLKTKSMMSICTIETVNSEYYLGRTYQKLCALCQGMRHSILLLKFKFVLSRLYLFLHAQMESSIKKNDVSARTMLPFQSENDRGPDLSTARHEEPIKQDPTSIKHASQYDLPARKFHGIIQSAPHVLTRLDQNFEHELRMPDSGLAVHEHIWNEALKSFNEEPTRSTPNQTDQVPEYSDPTKDYMSQDKSRTQTLDNEQGLHTSSSPYDPNADLNSEISRTYEMVFEQSDLFDMRGYIENGFRLIMFKQPTSLEEDPDLNYW
ncbi:uncharacterized protein V1516DRAFT_503996 [Lipomyces oligophaga]|uniref:uncharacterized protein n=1 Tax=Lipomyces oligophaga TaxID=45792 RepID=UPI0034CF95D8